VRGQVCVGRQGRAEESRHRDAGADGETVKCGANVPREVIGGGLLLGGGRGKGVTGCAEEIRLHGTEYAYLEFLEQQVDGLQGTGGDRTSLGERRGGDADTRDGGGDGGSVLDAVVRLGGAVNLADGIEE